MAYRQQPDLERPDTDSLRDIDMFFRKPRLSGKKAEVTFEQAVKQHAPELIRTAYRVLFNREADEGGLLHHSDFLRKEGKLEETMRRLLSSDEFLAVFEERSQFHNRAITDSLPAGKRIAIFSNCQGNNLGRCIQAMTGTRPPLFHFVTVEQILNPEQGLDGIRAALATHDVVLMQPLFADVVTPLLPELQEKLMLFPSLSFPAFQPDQCYVRIKGTFTEVTGPLGPYHSSIAFYAWQQCMSRTQTADLFCDAVYRELRFYDYWDSSAKALFDEGRRCGIPLEGLLKKWHARGCFMHSPNHPKLHALADLSRLMMQKLELEPKAIDPLEVVWDNLADTAIWPVYPEIARQLGVEGSYVFKGNNPGLPTKAPVVSYDLSEFISRSFDSFEQYSQKFEISCNRGFSERYQKLFGKAHEIISRPTPKTGDASPAAPRNTHPYAQLPDHQFWRKAVQQVPAAEVDPVLLPAFTLTKQTRIATAGSCFAQHISQRLKHHGFNYLQTETPPTQLGEKEARSLNYGVYSARYGNLYTARQLLQLFERAYGDFIPAEPGWQRPDGRLADPFRPEIEPQGFADAAALEASRQEHLAAVRSLFESVEVFVFTLGLTEAWRSRTDGAVFPIAPGVVAGEMNPECHEWVNFTVAEVIADLERFASRLAAVNPKARLLLTVSPVPLAATYAPQHVLSATTYSKSVLRAAAGELTERLPQCSYFPSYETITGNFNRGAYYDSDLRSVNSAGVDHVMRLFFAHYAPGAITLNLDAELLEEAENNYKVVCEEQRLDLGLR